LGIPFQGELTVRAKSEYRTDRRHYRDVFNDEQSEAISNAFAEEIRLLGYEY
jgi:hypothetical protein